MTVQAVAPPPALYYHNQMVKYLLIAGGVLSLVLGIIGIFLPIMPTTPFLLVSAACFLRSSKRLHHWLTTNRLFGRYIRMYIKYRAISKVSRIVAIALLWIFISISAVFFTDRLWLRILLGVIAAGVTIHLATLKTLTKEMIEEDEGTAESEPS